MIWKGTIGETEAPASLRSGTSRLATRPPGTKVAVVNPRLQIDPAICHGKPVIRGTRVLVSTILGALGGGDSIEAVLEDYPNITRQDVEAAREFIVLDVNP